MSELMTKTEAANLERLIRKQERVLKAACDQRAAELGAEFEAQISSVHHYTDDPKWKAIRRLPGLPSPTGALSPLKCLCEGCEQIHARQFRGN